MEDQGSETFEENSTFSTIVIDCGYDPDGAPIIYTLINFNVGAEVVWKISEDPLHPALKDDVFGPFVVVKIITNGRRVEKQNELGRVVWQTVQIVETKNLEKWKNGEDVWSLIVSSSILLPPSAPQAISDFPSRLINTLQKVKKEKENKSFGVGDKVVWKKSQSPMDPSLRYPITEPFVIIKIIQETSNKEQVVQVQGTVKKEEESGEENIENVITFDISSIHLLSFSDTQPLIENLFETEDDIKKAEDKARKAKKRKEKKEQEERIKKEKKENKDKREKANKEKKKKKTDKEKEQSPKKKSSKKVNSE